MPCKTRAPSYSCIYYGWPNGAELTRQTVESAPKRTKSKSSLARGRGAPENKSELYFRRPSFKLTVKRRRGVVLLRLPIVIQEVHTNWQHFAKSPRHFQQLFQKCGRFYTRRRVWLLFYFLIWFLFECIKEVSGFSFFPFLLFFCCRPCQRLQARRPELLSYCG